MAKIRFSNGQVVNFDGNPTEADIEEVAKKIGIFSAKQPSTPVEKPMIDKILESRISRGIQSFFPGKKLGQAIGTSLAAGGRLIQGDTKGFKDIMQTQEKPLRVGADIGNILLTTGGMALGPTGGASALSRIGQSTLRGAGLGAGISGTKAYSQDKPLGQSLKEAAIGGAVGGSIAGVTSAFGELLRRSGERITERVIKPTQADYKDGFSVDTIKKHNLGGSLDTMMKKTETKISSLSTELNQKLTGSNKTVDLNDAYNKTLEKLGGNKLKSFGSNTSMNRALEQLRGEIDDLGNGNMSIPDAQLIKQASGRMGSWQFGIQDPDSTAREKVYNAFYNTMKESIEKASPAGVKEINRQISELIPVQNAIVRRIPVEARNNLLSLQDMITLTASTFNPAALSGFALSLAQKSGSVGNLLMKTGPAVTRTSVGWGGIGAQGFSTLLPQSPRVPVGISQSPTALPDNTTFSPEVQRVLNMR